MHWGLSAAGHGLSLAWVVAFPIGRQDSGSARSVSGGFMCLDLPRECPPNPTPLSKSSSHLPDRAGRD